MTISRSGRVAARIAALLLMALVPLACDKEEPSDETTANVLPLTTYPGQPGVTEPPVADGEGERGRLPMVGLAGTASRCV